MAKNTSEINVIQEMSEYYQNFVQIFAKGVDFNLPGNGGIECYNYLPESQRLYETVLGCFVILFAYILSQKLDKTKNISTLPWTPSTFRKVLIVSMSFCIGKVHL